MCDLETLGTVPGCAILSIGVVPFDPLAKTLTDFMPEEGLYVVVSTEDCLNNFLHEDEGTKKWWGGQSPEARQVLADAEDRKKSVPLKLALTQMLDYIEEYVPPKQARVWGNGADFDNAIVNVAARAVGMKLPWSYGGRCYRTLKNMDELFGPSFTAPALKRSGTYHNALADARTQAEHLFYIIQKVRAL